MYWVVAVEPLRGYLGHASTAQFGAFADGDDLGWSLGLCLRHDGWCVVPMAATAKGKQVKLVKGVLDWSFGTVM